MYYFVQLQVEEYAKSRQLQLLGIYAANEFDVQGADFMSWPAMIAGKISENNSTALVLMVNNAVH